MAQPPSKRARPAFSPPRPKASSSTNRISKSKDTTRKSRSRPSLPSVDYRTQNRKEMQKSKQKARVTSPTPSNSEAADSDNQEGEESSSSEDGRGEEEEGEPEGSPEPDFILAEVSHEPSASSDPAIPLNLLQAIVGHHFQDQDKTKITKDAREVLGMYVEVFVREAIMRSSLESGEREGGGGFMGEDEEGGGGVAKGWLEVEDLERVGAQLCLDF